MNWPEPGIHFNVSEADYHRVNYRDGVISKSHLWKFAPSPWAWKQGSDEKVTDAMIWGSLIDCLLLQPGELDACFLLSPYDSYQTKAAQLWRDAQTLPIITAKKLAEARQAVEVLKANRFVSDLLKISETQVSVIANIQVPGTTPMLAKARIDIVPHGSSEYGKCLFDLKTVSSLDKIAWTMRDKGYDVQGAFYPDIWSLLAPERDRFGFIFQESSEPYEIALVELDPKDILQGRAWYVEAIRKWHECESTGNYPSPQAETLRTISLPRKFSN